MDNVSSKDYYSKKQVAEEYDNERFISRGGKMFDALEKEVVISNLPKTSANLKILDMGAGSGRFTIEIARRGFNVISSDYSTEMLRIINSKINGLCLGEYVSLSRQDITALTFDDNEFDYICCMRVFVNLDTRENVLEGIRELTRVCKPGGTIVFDMVNPISLAILGPTKDSMKTLSDTRKLLDSISKIDDYEYSGRRILSQTIFEIAPGFLLGAIDKLDYSLSKLLPELCVRIYFVVKVGKN